MLLKGKAAPLELPDEVRRTIAGSLNDVAAQVENPHNRAEIKVSAQVPTELPWISLGAGVSTDVFAVLDAVRSGNLRRPETTPLSGTSEMSVKVKDSVGHEIATVTIRTNPVDRTLGGTIETGEVKVLPNGEKIQGSISLEMKYKDDYHYFDAVGLTAKTLPGGETALKLTEIFTVQKPQQSPTPSSTPASVIEAVSAELRSAISPALARDQANFESITMSKSVSVIVPGEEVVRIGKAILTDSKQTPLLPAEVSPTPPPGGAKDVKLTYSEAERYTRREDGTLPITPVRFSESAVELSAEAGAELKGKVSLTLVHTTDPEKRETSETQRRLAAAIRSGTPAMKAASDLLGPRIPTQGIERAIRRIVSPTRRKEGGVRMEWDAATLSRVLATRTSSEDLQMLASLDQRLESAAGDSERDQILEEFRNDQNQRLLALRSTQPVDKLIAVSLRATLARAEPYRARWSELPDEVRFPGSLGRVFGYVLEPERDDLLLLGTAAGKESERIDLNDLVVSLQTVWRDHHFPLCSIDPDPDDLARPQKSRVMGVPADSGFALTMLNADYDMKRINIGLDPNVPEGFRSLASLLQEAPLSADTLVRFWFYPIQPKPGTIQISPDGRSALFSAGVQLLSEQMLRSQDGLIGSGSVFLPAQQAVESFTGNFSTLARNHPWFARLQGLFDVVLLAKILEQENISMPLLNQIVDLPVQPADVPKTYPVLVNSPMRMAGGVKANVAANPRTWLQADDAGFAAARQKADAVAGAAAIANPLPGVRLNIADAGQSASDLQMELAYHSLARSDFDSAMSHLERVLYADSFNASAYALKATVSLHRGDCPAATFDAKHARDLATENSPKLLASFVILECSMLSGKIDEAKSTLELALQLEPNSPRMHELKGLLLMQMHDISGARSEFRETLRLDPTYALAYATLGVLEAGQGWFARGKRLVETGYKLAPDLSAVKWSLAYLKVLNGIAYGDEEEAFRSAAGLAREVVTSAASDPFMVEQARLIPYMIALKHKDLATARQQINEAEKSGARLSVFFYLGAAQLAHSFDANELALQMITRAESVSPGNPQVAAARKDLEQ